MYYAGDKFAANSTILELLILSGVGADGAV